MRFETGIKPSTGYSSLEKLDYRRKVWSDLSRHIKPNTWAVMMPARGCEEIEAALECGVPIEQILCFDASAAVIATSLWRKKYPEIKFVTSKLSDLPKKLASLGRYVSAINMDLCGSVAGESVDEIDAFLRSGILWKNSAFSVNLAKGREGKTLLKALSKLNPPTQVTCDRMAAFCALSEFMTSNHRQGWFKGNYVAKVISQGTYREHRTPMTWATFSVAEVVCLSRSKGFLNALRFYRDTDDPVRFGRLLNRVQDLTECLYDGAINTSYEHQQYCFSRSMARNVDLSRDFSDSLNRIGRVAS